MLIISLSDDRLQMFAEFVDVARSEICFSLRILMKYEACDTTPIHSEMHVPFEQIKSKVVTYLCAKL